MNRPTQQRTPRRGYFVYADSIKVPADESEAHAFIVEACNAHDALVARVAELEIGLEAIAQLADEQKDYPFAQMARSALARGRE